ncbi:MAG TPA: hypothetical protein VHB97_19540 [Polyangia bacterium]|nr:hypothetical protein [Polyangia bacterium]
MRALRQLKRLLGAAGGLPLIWIALTIVALVPIWHQRLLPHLDTPNHLALVRAWHNYHDASYKIAEHYALRVRPVPYFLFYFTIDLLMYVVPIEVANKLFLSAYVVLYPLAILSLARALKRSPWLALGGFLLAFNQNWIYGFSSFLMGTTFMFFSLAALIRLLDDGRPRDAWALGVYCLLCYFSHVEAWVCFGIAAITLLLVHRHSWRRGLLASAAMLPSVLFAIAAYIEERHDRSYFHSGEGLSALNGTWRDFPTAIMEFPRRVMELFPGNLDRYILVTLTLTVLGLGIWRGTTLADDGVPQRKRLWTLLVVWLVVYVSLPYQIFKPMAWWYVSPRVPAMMAPLLLLLPALPSVRGRQRLWFIPIIICALVLPLKLAKLYGSFSQRNASFMRLVAELPRGAKVMVVVRNMMRGPGSEELSGDPASSAPVYWHFSSWPMALNGGYSPYLFDQGIPVTPRHKLKAPPWANTDTFDIRQAPDFEYYLVRDPTDEMEREPSLKLADKAGNWALFKRIYKSTDEP